MRLPFEMQLERYETALQIIKQWADAYPVTAFPEPDLARVRDALEPHGITLDAVSAMIIRQTVKEVGEIAGAALAD